jgi:Flp pilus assembly pilin Flp
MFSDLKAASMVEYAVLAVLILLAAYIAFETLGKDLSKKVEEVDAKFK